MKYQCGELGFSIEKVKGFGNNPGLWVWSQTDNAMIKVASFGSQEKADMFEACIQGIIKRIMDQKEPW